MRSPHTRALTGLSVAVLVALTGCSYTSPEERAASHERAALLTAELDDLGVHLRDGQEITGYNTDGFRRVLRFVDLGKLLCYVEDDHADTTTVDEANPPTLMCAPFKKKTTTEPDAVIVLRTVTVLEPTAEFRPIGDFVEDLDA